MSAGKAGMSPQGPIDSPIAGQQGGAEYNPYTRMPRSNEGGLDKLQPLPGREQAYSAPMGQTGQYGSPFLNSGLARFGAGGNYQVPQYQPRNYQPQALAPSRGLVQQGIGTPSAAPGSGQGGSPGGGIGGSTGGNVGGNTSGMADPSNPNGFSAPDNGIASGQSNTTGLTAAGLAALGFAANPNPATAIGLAQGINGISTTVGPAGQSDAVAAAAAQASQNDSDPGVNGTVGDQGGVADGGNGQGGPAQGSNDGPGDSPGDSGGGGGGGGK